MARAEIFEEWSGELADPHAWIEFPDGSPAQTPLQVFSGWVNHVMEPTIRRLVGIMTDLRTIQRNNASFSENLGNRIDELMVKSIELETQVSTTDMIAEKVAQLLMPVIERKLEERYQTAKNQLRLEQRLAKMEAMQIAAQAALVVPAKGAAAPVQPAPTPIAQAAPDTPAAAAPAPAVIPVTPSPAPAPVAPVIATPLPVVVAAPPAPPAPAQITDDQIRDMCINVCRELGRPTNIKMVEKCLTYNRTHGHDRLRQEILNYFKENTVKNDILALVPVRPEKIHVVYESTFLSNSKIVNSKLKIPPNYLLFIGNAYPHKNLALLLAALGSIPKKYSLVVVSKKTEFLERVLQSADLSLLARVQLQENVDDQGLAYLYQNARLTVTPSLMEGFGLPGLESLSVGTPVVASDIPAFREVYGNHVSYFDPLSAASLVRAINHTLKNSTRSNFVWNQTWARAAQEIAGVLG